MLFYFSWYIAQTKTEEFLEKNRDLSELLANSFDSVWTTTIDSSLFAGISFVGAVLGSIALAIFAYNWIQFQCGRIGYIDWTTIIIPTFLVILLAKPADGSILLGKMLLDMRNIGNAVSTRLLDGLSEGLTASEASDVAAAKTMMELIAADAVQTCAAIPEAEVRNDCFFDAEAQIVKLRNQYEDENPFVDNWATVLARELIRKIQDAQGTDYGSSKWFGRLFGTFGSAFQVANNFAVPILFLSIGYAFYWILEIVALLTTLISPLFAGMSLYSPGHKPFILSLSMSGGIWLTKLCYSIIIGFTGLLMSKTGSNPTLLFPLIAGFFGPLLAFFLGGGGGLAVFSVFTGAAAFSLRR